MELWMKIALIVMAIMSVLGLTAFIIVLRHVIPKNKWPYMQVSKKNKFEYIFDELRILGGRIGCLEERLDAMLEDLDEHKVKLDQHRSSLDGAHNRINTLIDRINNNRISIDASEHAFEDCLKKLKKRVKALEKVKEG